MADNPEGQKSKSRFEGRGKWIALGLTAGLALLFTIRYLANREPVSDDAKFFNDNNLPTPTIEPVRQFPVPTLSANVVASLRGIDYTAYEIQSGRIPKPGNEFTLPEVLSGVLICAQITENPNSDTPLETIYANLGLSWGVDYNEPPIIIHRALAPGNTDIVIVPDSISSTQYGLLNAEDRDLACPKVR